MPARKSDAEKGPTGAWATHAREDVFGDAVSVEQIAAGMLGRLVHPATIRKLEAGPEAKASKLLVRDLYKLYSRVGREKGILVPPPPGQAEAGGGVTDSPDLAAAINALVAMTERQNELLERLIVRVEDLGAVQGGQTQAIERMMTEFPTALAAGISLLETQGGSDTRSRGGSGRVGARGQ